MGLSFMSPSFIRLNFAGLNFAALSFNALCCDLCVSEPSTVGAIALGEAGHCVTITRQLRGFVRRVHLYSCEIIHVI